MGNKQFTPSEKEECYKRYMEVLDELIGDDLISLATPDELKQINASLKYLNKEFMYIELKTINMAL